MRGPRPHYEPRDGQKVTFTTWHQDCGVVRVTAEFDATSGTWAPIKVVPRYRRDDPQPKEIRVNSLSVSLWTYLACKADEEAAGEWQRGYLDAHNDGRREE